MEGKSGVRIFKDLARLREAMVLFRGVERDEVA